MMIEKENAALSLASEIKVLIEASRQNPPIGLILCTGEKATCRVDAIESKQYQGS